MDFFKKAFLIVVGAVAVAYDEAAKAIKEQQAKLEKATNKSKA